jgi:acetyl-CoA acyltransferase 2
MQAMEADPHCAAFFVDTLSGLHRYGTRYGLNLTLEDSLAAALTDRVPTVTPVRRFQEATKNGYLN